VQQDGWKHHRGVRFRVGVQQGAGQAEGIEGVGVVVPDLKVRCGEVPDPCQHRVQPDDPGRARLDPGGNSGGVEA